MSALSFPERVKQLVKDRDDLSVSKLGYLAYKPDVDGTSPDTFKKVMRGERRLPLAMAEAVAEVLGIDAMEFHEYRLALARESLDEQGEGGLDAAVDQLTLIETALQQAGLGALPATAQTPGASGSGTRGRGGKRSQRAV